MREAFAYRGRKRREFVYVCVFHFSTEELDEATRQLLSCLIAGFTISRFDEVTSLPNCPWARRSLEHLSKDSQRFIHL